MVEIASYDLHEISISRDSNERCGGVLGVRFSFLFT